MNILNLIETLNPGGAEILIENNLTWLKSHTDWDLEAAVLFDSGQIADRLKRKGITVHFLKLSNRFNLIEAIFKISGLLNKNNYDILHTHLFHANIYGRLAARFLVRRPPVVISSFHNPDYSFEDNHRFTFRIRKAVDCWTYKNVNFRGVAVSKAVAEDYKHHFGLKDVEVIYNSYLPFWQERINKYDKAAKRAALGFDSETNICVTVARFSYQKAYDIYVKAIKEITKTIKNIKFLFIGEGKEYNAIKDLVLKNNLSSYIVFLNRLQPEMVKDYVSMSDIFVLPSRFEAFGISALEAMIAKVPVIVTATGGFQELVKDGITAILVKPEDYNELAAKVTWALSNKDKMKTMTENAYDYAQPNFSIERTGYLWKEFYENLLYQYKKDKISINK